VSKGRREKGEQGYHNNQPLFGLMRDGKNLVPNPKELPGLILAFEAYATGRYGYAGVAVNSGKRIRKNAEIKIPRASVRVRPPWVGQLWQEAERKHQL
jgi:hypothetical protein